MRKALIAVAAIAVLIVAAVLVVPTFINWNAYKADIIAIAEKATGRALVIDGDIRLRLLPSPALSVSKVRLANPPGAVNANLISLESLEVQAAFWPLLRRELQVRSVRLRRPEIALEILADGTPTWEFTPAAADDAAPEDANGNGGGGGIAGITLEEFVIEGGRLSYFDAVSGVTQEVGSLDATLSAQELTTGPYDARGEFMARGVVVRFGFSVGDLAADGPIAIDATLALPDAGLSISLRGLISEAGPDAQLAGRIEVAGDDLRAAIAVLSRAADVDAPIAVPGAQPFSLAAGIDGSRTDVSINDIDLALGDTRASGAISVAMGDAIAIDAVLSFGRIDLDAWLATAALETPADETGGTNAENTAPKVADAADGGLSLPAIPANLSGSLSLSAQALTFRGDAVRQVELSAGLSDGVLRLDRLSALLPGGSDLVIAGRLAEVDGQPQFDGTLDGASDDLRGLLSWLGTDIDQVPSDRLRKLSLQTSVRLTGELVQIFGIDLRLDSTRVTGGAAYALRARPSFSVDLSIDRLNLDAYLAPAEDGADAGAADTPADDANGVAGGGLAAFAVLDGFDANIALDLDTLTFRDTRIDGVRLDGTLLGGAFTLREARIDSAAGASVLIDGTARNFAGPMEFATNIAISAGDASGLLRLLSAGATVPGKAVGGLEVNGAVSGTPETLAFDLVARLGATRANVDGTLALTAAQRRIDVNIGVLNDSLADFTTAIGVPLTPVTPDLDGPLSLAGTLNGDIESLAVDLNAVVAGAEIGVAGVVEAAATAPAFNMALTATHPNLTDFLGALGVDYQPAAGNLGAFGLSADIAGGVDGIQLTALEASIGPVGVRGGATLAFAGPRPRIVANLNTSEIVVDLFLPRAGGKTAAGGAAAPAPARDQTAGRWSSDPLDLSILRAIDGEIELVARGLTYGNYRFEEPSLVLRLADGVLDIDPLQGVLFDGDVRLRLRVEEGPALVITASIALAGADIERALTDAAGLNQVTGRFDLAADLATVGASQLDMVSALGGSLSFAARDGILRGIALGPLSDRLQRLDRALDFLALIQASLSGGETPYTAFQGTFDIANGVARSTDLSAVMEGAEGSGTAVVDLPAWQLDLRTRARLTGNPDAPDIGLDLIGPIDAPRRDIKSRDLEAYLAERVGISLLRRLLPGQRAREEGAAQDAPAEDEPGEALRPRDILRGIIRGIGN